MKKTFFAFVTLLLVSNVSAQITITSSDIRSLIGKTRKSYDYTAADTTGLSALIAEVGANKTWNVAGISFKAPETSFTDLRAFPDGAPFTNDPSFSSCNVIASVFYPSSYIRVWQYFALDNTGLYEYGQATDSAGLNAIKTVAYSPGYQTYKFPMTYGAAWSFTTNFTTRGITTPYTYNYSVDGYGTVTTPEGSFPCLRLKAVVSYNIAGYTGTFTDYQFLDGQRTYAFVIFSLSGGSILQYYRSTVVTAVQTSDKSSAQFSLAQNYPNPFNPTTTINYLIPQAGIVTLKVYDVLGNEIKTLVNEYKPAGKYTINFDASKIASGVYLYRLNVNDYTSTKKLVLLK